MLNSNKEWTISFSGCGFLSIYYLGVYVCLLERAQDLIERTTKICGASSGALIGAMIACQLSPAKCCKNLMELSKEARKGTLGSMHPSFNLLKLTRKLLVQELPSNAHHMASGRLCVSLTRVSDGQNVLVSEFASKNDLIQALICSCFFPLYCGVVPPSYHGTRYVDGALSNNLPYFSLRNTITVSIFSGESDICPYDYPFYFHEVRHSNVSIQVNFANVQRVIQAFFPPEAEVMAEFCENGYKDALTFLKENDLLEIDSPRTDLITTHKQDKSFSHYNVHNQSVVDTDQDRHTQYGSKRRQNCQLDNHEAGLLPEPIKKVISEARTKKRRWMAELFVVKLVTSILMLCLLPVETVYFTLLKFAYWTPEIASDLRWLWDLTMQMTGLVWRQLCSKEAVCRPRCLVLYTCGHGSD
ncbi:patatin-like phospholipase domain-containing protein 2 isoform X1 [Pygocentrus nattereri]|uniref:patatin-like phospholipase domain-containing protein 2 isoform X1 n=1 Tax=Pygocentrus nattereri TaxID=42514 RepID=UPI0018911386|nr:patatin-like phospholipase domain-containing protein 2 isoform X1 [Pygocentrus nattereri]